MRLEDKWRGQIQYANYSDVDSKSNYIKDDSLKEESSILTKVLGVSAVFLAGKKAFDKGYLANLAYDVIDTFGTNGIKNFENYTPAREFISRNLKTLHKALPGTDEIYKQTKYSGFAETAKAMESNLTTAFAEIKKDYKNVMKKRTKLKTEFSLTNTEFEDYIFQMNETMAGLSSGKDDFMNLPSGALQGISQEGVNFNKQVKNKMIDTLIKKMDTTPEDLIKDYNKTRTTKVTLGDIIKVKKETYEIDDFKNGGKIEKVRHVLSSKRDDYKMSDDTKMQLESILDIKDSNNESLISNFERIKNLRIDDAIRIDAEGNIKDLRGTKEKLNNFSKVITDDLSIPFLNLNPFRMIGIEGGVFKREKLFAGINKGTKQHILTDILNHDGKVISKNGGKYSPELTKDFVYINGDVYANHNNLLEKVADNMKVLTIKNDRFRKSNPKKVDSMRKIFNLKLDDFTEYNIKEHGVLKTLKGKIMKGLDIGFQDVEKDKVNYSDIMSYSNKFGDLLPKAWAERINKKNLNVFGLNANEEIDTNILINRSFKIKDLFDKNSGKNIDSLFKEIVAGRNDPRNVSNRTLNIYHLFERLNSSLTSVGLGMSTDNLGSTPDVIKHLITKRILPVYAARDLYHYTNMKSEEMFGEEYEDKAAEIVVGADVGMAKVRDALGITAFSKRKAFLMPGIDQIEELPLLGGFLNAIGGNDTAEEREDFWKNGEVAVRKGRWWSLGNTAFTGGKTEYFTPNAYRRIKGDATFTDSKYGSKKEYLKHITWMPNLENNLGLNKIMFPEDAYHYEMKHYNDRPYLETGGAFDTVPMIGPVLQKTLGKFIKPKKKMHEEYWNKYGISNDGTTDNKIIYEDLKAREVLKPKTPEDLIEAQLIAKEIVNPKNPKIIPLLKTDEGKIVEYDDDFINTHGKISRDYAGGRYSKYSPSSSSVPLYKDENDELITPNQRIIVPEDMNSWENTIAITKDKLAELTGIYGYGAETLANKKNFKNKYIIETPSYEMSLNDAFWDKSMGGFGGEISEIYRRFFNKRSKQNYFNPIKNTQADWMPGNEYFKDFQHGDPYSKVKQGEMRMAGEGYEVMNGRDKVFEMPLTISDVSKSPEQIAKDYVTEAEKPTGYLEYARKRGRQIDSQIKQELSKKGLIKDIEVGVRNEEYDISGKYDIKIIDLSSKQGESPLEIKSISEENFLKLEGPDYTQMEKMNFVLNETGYEHGHIMYVNRSKPQERKTFVITPNKELYEATLKKSNEARQILINKANNGELDRKQLYSPFHRFKILADVAPYSEKFKEYKEKLNRMVLTDEQEKEKQEILKQVDARYDSVRIYDYRFKDTKTIKTRLTVENVLRDGKIMVREFDSPIKLAAVKTELGNEKMYYALKDKLKRGSKILVEHGMDNSKIKQDGYLTANVTKDGLLGNTNINNFLLNNKIAEEDEEDFSAPALKIRFTDKEIQFGKLWEKAAHLNTFPNTKLMQVRSGLESYKRRDIYGKDFQKWEEPINDFLIPYMNQVIESDSLFKASGILILASMAGATPFGKAITTLGLTAWLVGGKVKAKTEEYKSGEKWIPHNREKEMEYREYLDKIKYIKNKKIAKMYYDEAKEKDGFDIDKFNEDKRAYNRYFYRVNRKKRPGIKDLFSALWDEEFLEYAKKKWVDKSTRVELNFDDIYNEQLVKYVKTKLALPINKRKMEKYSKQYAISKKKFYESEYAQKAKEYDDIAEKETMYGYDHYDNIYRLFKGMPKRDRKYIESFNNASVEEKGEILKIAPKYLRRILEKEWGVKMEKRTNLKEYFKHHALPGQDWVGWNPLLDMDIIKTKLIKNAEMDLAEFDIWDDNVKAANDWGEIALPDVEKKSSGHNIKKQLKKLLSKEHFEEIEVEYNDDDKSDLNVDLRITKDQHKSVMEKLLNLREYL